MGAYTMMSIAQGGCGLLFLATAVFRYYGYGGMHRSDNKCQKDY